ncbi:MAG: TolB family protein, partial [Candidatus Binataceae bacterium]
VTDRTGAMEIWVRSRDGQWERPVVTAANFPGKTETLGSLAFSPDGRTLAFHRRGTGQATVWLTPATGGTPVRLITDDEYSYHDGPSWSPDGEWVAIARSQGPEFSMAKIRVGTKETVTLIDTRVVPFSRPAWSPDGRWIACETFDGLVRVSADGGTPEVMLTDPVLAYAWSFDSTRIVALAEGESIGRLALIELDPVTREVKTLNPDLGTIPIANQPVRGFSFAKGQGYLTSLASARSDIWLLEGFQVRRNRLFDWFRR